MPGAQTKGLRPRRGRRAANMQNGQRDRLARLPLESREDLVHQQVIDNPGVPRGYPWLCLGYDAVLAGWILIRR